MNTTICWLGTPASFNPERVGGKAAQLGRLAHRHPVPPGFCITAPRAARLPAAGPRAQDLQRAYQRLARRCGTASLPVAVRSSAADEDGAQVSFAGQHESYLNITGPQQVIEAVKYCLASAQSERTQAYRYAHGLEESAPVAVLVQQFIHADVSAVVFSADPRSSNRGLSDQREHVVINATWGLGESLVGGEVTPDLYVVRKSDLVLVEQQIADKAWMTVASEPTSAHTDAPRGTRLVRVPRMMRQEPSLTSSQVTALARLARELETTQGWAVDLECAFQGHQLYLLQCRPITTLE